MKSDLLQRVRSGEILFCDGSIGVMLQMIGCGPDKSVEKWGLEHSDVLKELHSGYVEAGADIIITNTFGANRIKLDKHKLGSHVEYLNKSLAEIALEVASKAQKKVYVAGNIGPTGELMEPFGTLTESDLIEVYSQQAKALFEAGVDLIFIETMIDVNEASAAVKAAKMTCDLPVFASMSFNPGRNGFRTVMGNSPEVVTLALQEAGADVVGANCGGVLASDMPGLVKQIKSSGARFVVVEPNAGIPQVIQGKTVFPQSPEDMAQSFPDIIDAGANIVGGCCGVTKAHLSKIIQISKDYLRNTKR